MTLLTCNSLPVTLVFCLNPNLNHNLKLNPNLNLNPSLNLNPNLNLN